MSEQSDNGPLRYAISHEEAMDKAKLWMRETYGAAKDLSPEQRDRYHERLGLLVDFLHTLLPPN